MSLKKEFLSGVFYTAVAKYSGIVISLIVSSILARLLTPQEFGVVGVATVIIAFFNILGDIGIGPAVILHKELTDRDLSSIHTFTTYTGLVLGAFFFLSADIIADIYEDNKLVGICRLLSLSIVFTCWGIVPLNLSYKLKKFRKIAIVTLGVQLVSGFGACIYAFYGGGVYALVFQFVASSLLLSFVYNLSCGLKWSFKVTKESVNKIKSFSSYQFLFNILSYFSRNSDKLLIGRYIGLSQLGYYEKSYKLMMLPLQNITFVISPVLLPIFSTIKDDVALLGEKYIKLLIPLAYLAFPISVILYFCSPVLILIIFGSQWISSIAPLQILSFTVGFQILSSTTGGIFQALGETKRMFHSGCWGAFFIVGSFIVSILGWRTIVAVCVGYLIAQIANIIQCFYSLFKALDLSCLILFRSLLKPMGISCLIFVIMWAQNLFLPIAPIWLSLLVKVLLGIFSTIIIVQLTSPYNLYKIIKKGNIE